MLHVFNFIKKVFFPSVETFSFSVISIAQNFFNTFFAKMFELMFRASVVGTEKACSVKMHSINRKVLQTL